MTGKELIWHENFFHVHLIIFSDIYEENSKTS